MCLVLKRSLNKLDDFHMHKMFVEVITNSMKKPNKREAKQQTNF